jgi:hypothetical protein
MTEPTAPAPDLSIVIVSYNMMEDLKACLASIYRETSGLDFEVIVVDNASSSGDLDGVRGAFPQAQFIVNAVNRGFAAANNQGIAVARGRHLLLLNPDTEILDGAIQKTVEFMGGHPTAGIVGCRLVFGDRSPQRSVGTFPSILSLFLEASFLYLLLPRNALLGPTRVSVFDDAADGQVDWVLGAYMLIRREVVDRIGLLDEQFFVYTEEVDFCRRTWDAGFEIWYTPSATIVHYCGGVRSLSQRTILWTFASQMLYIRKYHRGWRRGVLIFLKYAGMVARIGVHLLLGLVTFNRARLAKSRYWAYSVYRLLTTRLEYRTDPPAEVVPWTRIL